MRPFVAFAMILQVAAISAGYTGGGTEGRSARGTCRQRRMPETILSVVSVPEAFSANICDKLAAQVTEATHGKTVNGAASTTLQLEKDAVQELIELGILGTKAADLFAAESEFGIWTVPARMETGSTRKPHVDRPPDGLPFDASTLVYLTDAKGALHFPDTNESVAIKKGSVVAFPAGTVHAVLNSGPRIYLGPFTESPSPRIKRRTYASPALTPAPTPAPTPTPASWQTMNGCCRERVAGAPKRKRFLNHHDSLFDKMTIVGGTMAQATAKCKQACEDETTCIAVEVHKSKKTKNKNRKKKTSKGFTCELHTANINSASRKSKTCKKAKCFTPATPRPTSAPAPTSAPV